MIEINNWNLNVKKTQSGNNVWQGEIVAKLKQDGVLTFADVVIHDKTPLGVFLEEYRENMNI